MFGLAESILKGRFAAKTETPITVSHLAAIVRETPEDAMLDRNIRSLLNHKRATGVPHPRVEIWQGVNGAKAAREFLTEMAMTEYRRGFTATVVLSEEKELLVGPDSVCWAPERLVRIIACTNRGEVGKSGFLGVNRSGFKDRPYYSYPSLNRETISLRDPIAAHHAFFRERVAYMQELTKADIGPVLRAKLFVKIKRIQEELENGQIITRF